MTENHSSMEKAEDVVGINVSPLTMLIEGGGGGGGD